MFDVVKERELVGCSERHVRRCLSSNVQCLQRMELQRKLEGHVGCVNTVSFDTELGNLLISGSDDQNIILWDWQTGVRRLKFDSGHHNNVFQARMMPQCNATRIVTCAADGQVRLAELPEGVSTESVTTSLLGQHGGRAHKLALDPLNPGHCFYSCGEDGQVMHYDLRCSSGVRGAGSSSSSSSRSGGRQKLLVCHGFSRARGPTTKVVGINAIHCNPTRPWQFAIGGCDTYARVYDCRRTRDVTASIGPPTRTQSRESRIYSMSDEPVARLCPQHMWRANNTRNNRRSMVGDCHITCVMFSKQGELLASYNDEDIYLFSSDASNGCLSSSSSSRRNSAAGYCSSSSPQQQQQQQQRKCIDSSSPAQQTSPSRRRRAEFAMQDSSSKAQMITDTMAQQQQQQQQQQQRDDLAAAAAVDDNADNEGRPRWRRRQVSRSHQSAAAAAAAADSDDQDLNENQNLFGNDGRDLDQHNDHRSDLDHDGSRSLAAAPSGPATQPPPAAAAAAPEPAAATAVAAIDISDLDALDDDDEDTEAQQQLLHNYHPQQQQRTTTAAAGSNALDQNRGFGIPAANFYTSESYSQDGVIASYYGHRNAATVKGVAFFGEDDEYVISGSDCGHVYIWSEFGGEIVWWRPGDEDVVNCLEPHPFLPLVLATSGIEHDIKIWAPTAARPQPPSPLAVQQIMARNKQDRDSSSDLLTQPEQWLLQLLATQRRSRLMSRQRARRTTAAAAAAGNAAEQPAAAAAADPAAAAAGDGQDPEEAADDDDDLTARGFFRFLRPGVVEVRLAEDMPQRSPSHRAGEEADDEYDNEDNSSDENHDDDEDLGSDDDHDGVEDDDRPCYVS